MTVNFPPAPTYAPPIEEDHTTKKPAFSPMWIQWFLDLQRYFTSIGFAGGNLDLSGYARLQDPPNIFTRGQTVTTASLTDAPVINTDATLSNHFTVTLGGNRTLANPSNLRDGIILNFKVKPIWMLMPPIPSI